LPIQQREASDLTHKLFTDGNANLYDFQTGGIGVNSSAVEVVSKVPDDVMDDVVRKIIELREKGDVGLILIYNEYLQFLYRVLLSEKPPLDRERTAANIRIVLRKKKIKLGNQPTTPLGWEIELFNKILEDSETPYKDFKKILYSAINDHAKNKEVRYTVAYALNFKLEQPIESKINEISDSKIRERPFEIVPYSTFAATALETVENEKKEQIEFLLKTLNAQYSFCIIKDVYGRDDEFVLDYCNNRLISILGLLALSFGSPVTFGSLPRPVTSISSSHALVFKNGEYTNYLAFDQNKGSLSLESIDQEQIEQFTEFTELYNKIKAGAIIDRLNDALASFFQASIEHDMSSAYLKYWVCIENCKLASTHEQMIKRLSRLPFWPNALWSYQILLMREIRNDYVHKLKTEISQFDRNFAHRTVANLIIYLLRNGSKFSDEKELDLFIELVTNEDPESLSSHKNMAELASKQIKDYKSRTISKE
jgi:hypothetical protein